MRVDRGEARLEESDDAVTWLSMVSWEEWAEPVRVDEAYSQSITASTDAADRPEQKSTASAKSTAVCCVMMKRSSGVAVCVLWPAALILQAMCRCMHASSLSEAMCRPGSVGCIAATAGGGEG